MNSPTSLARLFTAAITALGGVSLIGCHPHDPRDVRYDPADPLRTTDTYNTGSGGTGSGSPNGDVGGRFPSGSPSVGANGSSTSTVILPGGETAPSISPRTARENGVGTEVRTPGVSTGQDQPARTRGGVNIPDTTPPASGAPAAPAGEALPGNSSGGGGASGGGSGGSSNNGGGYVAPGSAYDPGYVTGGVGVVGSTTTNNNANNSRPAAGGNSNSANSTPGGGANGTRTTGEGTPSSVGGAISGNGNRNPTGAANNQGSGTSGTRAPDAPSGSSAPSGGSGAPTGGSSAPTGGGAGPAGGGATGGGAAGGGR